MSVTGIGGAGGLTPHLDDVGADPDGGDGASASTAAVTTRSAPDPRAALAGFLRVPNPLPGAPTPGPAPGPGGVVDVGLPAVAGRSFVIHPQGYPVDRASPNQGPPGLHGEGAERIYRAGNALVEAPAGALRAVPAEAQRAMLATSVGQYERALAEAQGSRISETDAHKVRSGAAATLLAVYEGAATPEIKEQAARELLAFARKEPLEGLRANMYINLEAHAKDLSPALRADLDAVRELVLPSRPPYGEWFKDGNDTLEVVHYAHEECWEHATDPITRYKREGLSVTSETTNGRGEKEWILEGEMDGGNGAKQKMRIKLIQSHDEFCRDLDDPNVHAVFYSGHSNLGGNISEAIRRGPEENGHKLLSFQVCRGQQNLYEVANKYPNAHLSTSKDPSYFANLMDITLGTLKGVARRDTYEGINQKTRMTYSFEKITNYIQPNELRRFEYSDLDGDGVPDLGLDARDRFFDVVRRDLPADRTDLRPRATDIPAADLDATAVMSGANFARTLVTYHAEKSPGTSPLRGLQGDRIQAAGYFEGSDELVRVTEATGRDGKPVYNVSVNKSLKDQSAYAIGALIQFEFTRHFAEKDGTFAPEEKARALLMTGQYLSYMYCTSQEAEQIMRAVGNRAGVDNLRFRTVYEAIDSDGSGYSTDRQVQDLMRRVTIR